MIEKESFTEHPYFKRIFLDFSVPTHFFHLIERHTFKYYDAIVNFLASNPKITLYLTNKIETKNFQYFENDILANVDDLIKFCDAIGESKRNQNRIKAFFGQHVSLKNIQVSAEEKQQFIEDNLTEENLLESLKKVSPELQEKLLQTILELTNSQEENGETQKTSSDNLIRVFTNFLEQGKVQNSIFESLPQIQLNALKELKEFVAENLDKDESFFQNWIDESNGIYRKKRCLIFGIDYVDPKREGEIMGRKRFDILATQNRERHILIELKSPNAKLFDVKEHKNQNDGYLTTYKLSKDLSRAIPQILSYKKWYGQLNTEKVQELGISSKKEISECIIVIGVREEDDVWKENFQSLCENLKIKIWTYTDLIEKMENTINNIEQNL